MPLCLPSPDRGKEHGRVNKATLTNQTNKLCQDCILKDVLKKFLFGVEVCFSTKFTYLIPENN